MIADRDDDICISAITVSQPNGVQVMITGDIPSGLCSYWGYSESLTKIQTTRGDHRPHCFWMAGKSAVSPYPRSIVFHLEDFVGHGNHTQAYNDNNDAICAVQPRMHRYMNWPRVFPIFWPPLVYPPVESPEIPDVLFPQKNWTYLDVNYLQDKKNWKDKPDTWPWMWGRDGPKRRAVDASVDQNTTDDKVAVQPAAATPRKKTFYRKGVMHDAIRGGSVSARYACEKEHIQGPDILSHAENLYCDLDTRTLYPLCEKEKTNAEPCFDEEAMELVGAGVNDENKKTLLQVLGLGKRSVSKRNVMKKIVSPLNVDEDD